MSRFRAEETHNILPIFLMPAGKIQMHLWCILASQQDHEENSPYQTKNGFYPK